MTDGQLTANNSRRLFSVYSWPAAGDIYAHTMPNWVKWHSGGSIAYLTPNIASIGYEGL